MQSPAWKHLEPSMSCYLETVDGSWWIHLHQFDLFPSGSCFQIWSVSCLSLLSPSGRKCPSFGRHSLNVSSLFCFKIWATQNSIRTELLSHISSLSSVLDCHPFLFDLRLEWTQAYLHQSDLSRVKMSPSCSPSTTASECKRLSCQDLEPLPDKFSPMTTNPTCHLKHRKNYSILSARPTKCNDIMTSQRLWWTNFATLASHVRVASILRQIDCTSSVMFVSTWQHVLRLDETWRNMTNPDAGSRMKSSLSLSPSPWSRPRPGRRVEPQQLHQQHTHTQIEYVDKHCMCSIHHILLFHYTFYIT